MIDLSKVIYCIGNIAAKRLALRKSVSENAVFADNDEMLAAFNEQGKTFFVLGDYPFKDMTVYELVRYNRMILSGESPDKRALKRFFRQILAKNLPLNKKVRALDVFAYRAVIIASRITEKTTTVAVSFDGLTYTKERERALTTFLNGLRRSYEVLVSVTDNRFIKSGAVVRRYSKKGYTELSTATTSREMRGKSLIKAYSARRGVKIERGVRKIVVAV